MEGETRNLCSLPGLRGGGPPAACVGGWLKAASCGFAARLARTAAPTAVAYPHNALMDNRKTAGSLEIGAVSHAELALEKQPRGTGNQRLNTSDQVQTYFQLRVILTR